MRWLPECGVVLLFLAGIAGFLAGLISFLTIALGASVVLEVVKPLR
jgi:hypothetical protein